MRTGLHPASEGFRFLFNRLPGHSASFPSPAGALAENYHGPQHAWLDSLDHTLMVSPSIQASTERVEGDTALPIGRDARSAYRDVVIGRRSKVWRQLAKDIRVAGCISHAISHGDLADFGFTPNDRLWVFSYSRREEENRAMLARLQNAGVAEIVYVSSSSTVVANVTSCYEYPRVKLQAESLVEAMPEGRILTIGLVYDGEHELPAGKCVATSICELADFMLGANWPDNNSVRKNLLRVVNIPFSSRIEELLYRWYGVLIEAAGRFPCLLRPLDLVLRGFGMRWYGYVYLSNRAWISTIS